MGNDFALGEVLNGRIKVSSQRRKRWYFNDVPVSLKNVRKFKSTVDTWNAWFISWYSSPSISLLIQFNSRPPRCLIQVLQDVPSLWSVLWIVDVALLSCFLRHLTRLDGFFIFSRNEGSFPPTDQISSPVTSLTKMSPNQWLKSAGKYRNSSGDRNWMVQSHWSDYKNTKEKSSTTFKICHSYTTESQRFKSPLFPYSIIWENPRWEYMFST